MKKQTITAAAPCFSTASRSTAPASDRRRRLTSRACRNTHYDKSDTEFTLD